MIGEMSVSTTSKFSRAHRSTGRRQYIIVTSFLLFCVETVLATCEVGSFRTRLRDCPLHQVSLSDGDEVTLSFTEIEWSLPLLRGHRTGDAFDDGWDEVEVGVEPPLEEYGSFLMRTKTLQLGDEANPRIPAPVIRVEKGANVKVNLVNALPVDSGNTDSYRVNIHTHGAHISPNEDDSTVVVKPGESHLYDYKFPGNHAGGTHWYHPHINTLGELHVSGGAVGAMIVEDGDGNSEIPEFVRGMQEEILVIQRIRPQRLQQVSLGDINDPFSTRLYVKDDLFSIGDNAPSEDDDFPFYLVNGFLQPTLELEEDKWYRFRFVHTSSGNDLYIHLVSQSADQSSSGCTVKLLAKDGVYLPGGPRDVGTGNTPMRFTPATRVDVAVRCTAAAGGRARLVGSMLTEEYEDIEMTLLEMPVEARAQGVDVPVESTVSDFSFKPCLPRYLPDLRLPQYTVENKEEFNITISPFTINEKYWLGFQNSPNISVLELDKVYQWTMNHSHHSFHAHINHFLIVDNVDYWDQSGDYVDTIQALDDDHPIRFRFLTDKYDGRLTMHCHNLDHADEGAMAQGYILPPSTAAGKAKALEFVPWDADCPAEVEFDCTSQDGESCPLNSLTSSPTNSPTTFPSASPTKYPTASPTSYPTLSPTKYPTTSPTNYPTATPTNYPTASPTKYPTSSPTKYPTSAPTKYPTASPTKYPTASPTKYPTASPNSIPSASPTKYPTTSPSGAPSASPTVFPTKSPTEDSQAHSPTNFPTPIPTKDGGANQPTPFPTKAVTLSPTSTSELTLFGILSVTNTNLPPNSDSVGALEGAIAAILNGTSTEVTSLVSTGDRAYDVYFLTEFETAEDKTRAKEAISDSSTMTNMVVKMQEVYGDNEPTSDLKVLGVRIDPDKESPPGDGAPPGGLPGSPTPPVSPGEGPNVSNGQDYSGVALGASLASLLMFGSIGVVLHRNRVNNQAFERTVKRARAIPPQPTPKSISLTSVGPLRDSVRAEAVGIVNVAQKKDVFENGKGWVQWEAHSESDSEEYY